MYTGVDIPKYGISHDSDTHTHSLAMLFHASDNNNPVQEYPDSTCWSVYRFTPFKYIKPPLRHGKSLSLGVFESFVRASLWGSTSFWQKNHKTRCDVM